MKQYKDGKKVQNWHKPLGESELKHHYKQIMHKDPDFSNICETLLKADPYYEELLMDFRVTCSNDRHVGAGCQCDECIQLLDEDDLIAGKLMLLINEVVNAMKNCSDIVPQSIRPIFTSLESAQTSNDTSESICKEGIESRLYDYMNKLVNVDVFYADLKEQISSSIGDFRNIGIIEENNPKPYWSFGFNKFKYQVLLFSPFWVRTPMSWDKQSDTGLIEHLFVKHACPVSLRSVFHEEWWDRCFKWVIWFIVISQGGSLKSAGIYFNWRVEGDFQQILQEINDDFSPCQACYIAEIKRLGGIDIDVTRILKAKVIFHIDPTEYIVDRQYQQFWLDTVRWHIEYRNEITDMQSSMILEWAIYQYSEYVNGRAKKFAWNGLSSKEIIQRSLDFSDEKNRCYVPCHLFKWQGHGWDWEFEDAEKNVWSFSELTSSESLYFQWQSTGTSTLIFTGNYLYGRSAIFSLKVNGESRITINLNPKTKTLYLARGKENRLCCPEENIIIAKWVSDVVRSCNI